MPHSPGPCTPYCGDYYSSLVTTTRRWWLLLVVGDYYYSSLTTTTRCWLLLLVLDYYYSSWTTTTRWWLLLLVGDYYSSLVTTTPGRWLLRGLYSSSLDPTTTTTTTATTTSTTSWTELLCVNLGDSKEVAWQRSYVWTSRAIECSYSNVEINKHDFSRIRKETVWPSVKTNIYIGDIKRQYFLWLSLWSKKSGNWK